MRMKDREIVSNANFKDGDEVISTLPRQKQWCVSRVENVCREGWSNATAVGYISCLIDPFFASRYCRYVSAFGDWLLAVAPGKC